jgi:hypothetical protein
MFIPKGCRELGPKLINEYGHERFGEDWIGDQERNLEKQYRRLQYTGAEPKTRASHEEKGLKAHRQLQECLECVQAELYGTPPDHADAREAWTTLKNGTFYKIPARVFGRPQAPKGSPEFGGLDFIYNGRVIFKPHQYGDLSFAPNDELEGPIFVTNNRRAHKKRSLAKSNVRGQKISLEAAIEDLLAKGQEPGRNIPWKTFCDNVREMCGTTAGWRGYSDRSIKRAVAPPKIGRQVSN